MTFSFNSSDEPETMQIEQDGTGTNTTVLDAEVDNQLQQQNNLPPNLEPPARTGINTTRPTTHTAKKDRRELQRDNTVSRDFDSDDEENGILNVTEGMQGVDLESGGQVNRTMSPNVAALPLFSARYDWIRKSPARLARKAAWKKRFRKKRLQESVQQKSFDGGDVQMGAASDGDGRENDDGEEHGSREKSTDDLERRRTH